LSGSLDAGLTLEINGKLDKFATKANRSLNSFACTGAVFSVSIRPFTLFGINKAVINFQPIQPEDYDAVRRFLSENGWEKRISDAEKFAKMMRNANRTVVAFDGSRVVGFARALCDEVSNGYIGTVAVAVDFRGRGIGRELVSRLISDNPEITWVLRAGHESREFWEKMGFSESQIAMEKTRTN
jgi:ribosomal protein S18 acetylase RimI-like enzyme